MESLELVLATENPDKVKEFQRLLKGVATVLSLKDVGFSEEFPEEGEISFRENSQQKARFVGERLKRKTIADDSGFEVEALKNAPGVISARYGGTSDPAQQRPLVLEQASNATDRRARFVCELSFFDPEQNRIKSFRGTIEGQLTTEERGENGFGYDPIFMPEGYTQTFAEMDADKKDKVSHRGRAIQLLRNYLTRL